MVTSARAAGELRPEYGRALRPNPEQIVGKKFQPGDVVYLKSGSEPMVVTAADEERCELVWHYAKIKYETKHSSLPHACLQAEQPD